jgi:hypothetical protein
MNIDTQGTMESSREAHPLRRKPLEPECISPATLPEFQINEGTFRVDMIDTWNMRVYLLEYTTGPTQPFHPELFPGLMRFAKVDHAATGKPTGSLIEVMNEFWISSPRTETKSSRGYDRGVHATAERQFSTVCRHEMPLLCQNDLTSEAQEGIGGKSYGRW